jgi:hypothetical protein
MLQNTSDKLAVLSLSRAIFSIRKQGNPIKCCTQRIAIDLINGHHKELLAVIQFYGRILFIQQDLSRAPPPFPTRPFQAAEQSL